MSGYEREFDETKFMSFLIKDGEFLEKVSNNIKKEFDSEPVCNEKYIKTKINLIMEKSTKTFIIITYQKKVLDVHPYQ